MIDFLIQLLGLTFPLLLMLVIMSFHKDKKSYLKKFALLFVVGCLSSAIPFLSVGMVLGYYAYTVNAAIVAAFMEFKGFE